MAYVATNYTKNSNAPAGKWTCAPSSQVLPMDRVPSEAQSKGPDFCGQCVSYVKQVCPSLPATAAWKKGIPVKGAKTIVAGTVIATFNASNAYEGHAAIYVSQNKDGINVYDQYRTPPAPKAVGPRLLRWGASGNSNNGDKFHVVD
jgi:hypothetical protein